MVSTARFRGRGLRMSRVAGTFLLLVLLESVRSVRDPAAADRDPSGALAVAVSETADAVLLHIRASGGVEPGSVEVRFAGRKTVVLARDAGQGLIRSRPLHLPQAVVEDGSSAEYLADGSLVVTLRRQAVAQDTPPRAGDGKRADR